MRVALLALNFAEYASRLAVALSARHEVLLLLRTRNAESELTGDLRGLLDKSVNVEYLEPRRWRDPRVLGTCFAINRILRRFAPDVLHVQEIHPVLGGGTILSFRRTIPVVYTVHDPVNHTGQALPQNGLRWKILMWFRRRTSRLIVHGPQMRAALEALDRRIAARIDVIPHGVLGRASVDEDLSGREPATFLFFGRIEPYKGLKYFLRAGEILQSRGHALKLVVAGTGTDLESHRERIAASGVDLVDRYISPKEVAGLFRRATAVVLPYTDGTQSGVAAIALAKSRPVIATAVGDLPDVVIHGRTGLLVPPCDATALADAMERLVVDRSLRDSLAAGAGQLAKDRLSWSRIAELTEAAYRRAVESHRLGGPAVFRVADESE